MDTNTGKIYEGDEIEKAQERGEHLAPVSPKVAELLREARAERLRIGREKRHCGAARRRKERTRGKAAMERASRKRNR